MSNCLEHLCYTDSRHSTGLEAFPHNRGIDFDPFKFETVQPNVVTGIKLDHILIQGFCSGAVRRSIDNLADKFSTFLISRRANRSQSPCLNCGMTNLQSRRSRQLNTTANATVPPCVWPPPPARTSLVLTYRHFPSWTSRLRFSSSDLESIAFRPVFPTDTPFSSLKPAQCDPRGDRP